MSLPPGDIVGFFVGGRPVQEKPLSGVVTRSSDTSLSVAVDDLPDSVDLNAFTGQIQVVRLANDVTYRRTKRLCVVEGGREQVA